MIDHKVFLRFLLRGNRTYFDVTSSQQRAFLYSLPEPKDDFERSFFQYKCQNYFAPKWKPIVLNFIAIIAFFPLLLFYIVKSLFVRNISESDAISDLYGMKEVIPADLQNRYKISFFGKAPTGMLRVSDIPFVLSIFVNFFPDCYFSLKAMAKVSQYSELIRRYKPSCIIAHHEYSFSSSILTTYCNRRQVRHVNVMHGEKLFNIVDSFFHFNECYVWDEHYRSLFVDLRAEPSQFVVAIPQSLTIDIEKYYNPSSWADYKYYLAEFTEDEIKSIVDSMAFAKRQGKTVKYRFHPRYYNQDILYKYVLPTEVENPREVSIQESIASCDYTVSSYSTVLFQAYCSGKQVVLDDVTYRYQFERLEDLRYVLIKEGCPRLSSLE